MHFERYSRWIWPQKSMKFISIDENLWHKPKAFDFRSCLCLCFRLWIYSYSTICVCRFVCAAQFICLTIPSPEVGQCQRKFFFLSLCINIWLSIWTPLPMVINNAIFTAMSKGTLFVSFCILCGEWKDIK